MILNYTLIIYIIKNLNNTLNLFNSITKSSFFPIFSQDNIDAADQSAFPDESKKTEEPHPAVGARHEVDAYRP